MRTGKAILAFSLGMALTTAAAAQDLPDWTIAELCPSQADFAACAEFESRARRIVAGPWPTFSPQVRYTCLRILRRQDVKSYRTLQECLEDESFREHGVAQQRRTAE